MRHFYSKINKNIFIKQWLAANIKNMEYNEFVYGTKYALSLASYQLVELNEVGIPVKQAKKVGLK